jgi:hypothetical protein
MQNFGQKLFFALFCFGLFSCKPTIDRNKSLTFSSAEIFNGQKADPTLFKQVVALIKEGDVVCSASAVKKRLLFSSAHCFIDFEEFEVKSDGNTDNFDELFSSLDDEDYDYCQSFSECQEELDNLNNKKEKREYLEDHVDQLIEQLQEEMTIHIGEGVQGGSIEGEDIIKSIHIHPDWINLLKLKLYDTFDIISRSQKVDLKNIHEFDEYSFDYAQIKLKKSIPARKIIRPLKEDFFENEVIPDGSKVVLVGFGHQFPNNKEREEEEYRLAYGVKMSVELPLAGIIRNDSGLFAISAGEETGACQGDSGGGAFIKFPDGRLKYLGIITAGGDLCGEAIFWENNGTSIQGNTIINIQLDTDEI